MTFSVSQTWSNSPVCLLATEYSFNDAGDKTCDDNDNVAPGEVGSYTAICHDGVAEITVFVQDAIFAGANTEVSGLCERFESGENTISYAISIPCLESDVCGEIPPLEACEDDSDMIIAEENFEAEGATESWFYADAMQDDELTTFLVPEDEETSKTFSVPSEASAVSITFDMYELADSDHVYLRIQDSYPDLGRFSLASNDDKSGFFANIRATVVSLGESMNQVTLVIPSSWFTTGRLTFGFKGAVGIDNLVVTSICGYTTAPTGSPTGGPTGSPTVLPECIEITPSSPSSHEFDFGPVQIISHDGESVSFTVSQTWSDSPVCLLATEYTSVDGEMACVDKSYVAPGEVGLYTAFCVDGVAEINIFVQDALFSGSTAVVPGICELFESGDNTLSYAVTIPCVDTPSCDELPEPLTCSSDSDMVLSEENFEAEGEADSWFYASAVKDNVLTTFIVPEGDEMSKAYTVPSGASAVSVTMDLYELSGTDGIYLRIHDSYPDIGRLLASSAATVSGYFADIRATVVKQGDSLNQITLHIPSSWFTTGRLTLGVKGNVGLDNIVITSICTPETTVGGAPRFTPPSPAKSPTIAPIASSTAVPVARPTVTMVGVNYTYSPPAQGACPCTCNGEEKSFTPDSWSHPGLPANLRPNPAFMDTTDTLEAQSCLGLGESATHPRVAMPCSNSDTMYYLVQDSQSEYAKLSALKLSGGSWSYVGGSRYVSYDAKRVVDASNVPAMKVAGNGGCTQSFDIQARGEEVCFVALDDTASVGGANIPTARGTPVVYCLDKTDNQWREVGQSSRIGVADAAGDIELLLPSACECANMMGYYFVMVGKAALGHLKSVDVTGSAVVWYYNSATPEAGWRPVGGDSEKARVIPGHSSDAHLAITGTGNFACAVHAVVSDDSNLRGFDVFEGDNHLVVARFEPSVGSAAPVSLSSGRWRALDELVYGAAFKGAANSAKACANDFVFTKSGIPAVGWVDAANGGFAYLSVWPSYPTALASDSQGFEVAARTVARAGAIPPTAIDKPGYISASGMSIDAYEDAVFVAITDSVTKKVYISYIDLSASTVQWHEMESETADLLPQDQDRSICSDSLTSQTTAGAQNHIKIACNGNIVVGHIIAKSSAPLSIASVAVNGNPLLASATAGSSTVDTMCAGGVNQVISSEDFETKDTSGSWSNGLLSDCVEMGHYLGPLTGSGDIISKVFAVPSMASSIEFSYDFYNVGNLGSSQMLYVKIDSQRIDLPYLAQGTKSGSTGGIVWSYTKSGKVYSTKLTIPQYYFSDGFVRVQFDLYHSLATDATKKAGIDKITLKAVCSGAQRRAEESAAAAASGEVGEFYCSSSDFPCGDDNKSVYVCHYSARSGYNTYCVPEADSEVLRFYKQSFCGPCVGLGGVLDQ